MNEFLTVGMYELTGAVVVLLVTLGVGTVVHELTHVFVLRWLGVGYDIAWRPLNATEHTNGFGINKAWASVTPTYIPEDLSPWGLRVAALAPVALAIPSVLILAGILPDPLVSGNLYITAAAVAWLAIALPSPQDFSLFWYAGRAVEEFEASPIDVTEE